MQVPFHKSPHSLISDLIKIINKFIHYHVPYMVGGSIAHGCFGHFFWPTHHLFGIEVSFWVPKCLIMKMIGQRFLRLQFCTHFLLCISIFYFSLSYIQINLNNNIAKFKHIFILISICLINRQMKSKFNF